VALNHPVNLKDPAGLTGNELVLKLPNAPGGTGVDVGVTVNGKPLDENTLDHGEVIMSHITL
jgi:hypothetical protein